MNASAVDISTFDLSRFAHDAVWNAKTGRIEMYLESLADQTAHVLGRGFAFAKGDTIHTENSHKYTVDKFQALARGADEIVLADPRASGLGRLELRRLRRRSPVAVSAGQGRKYPALLERV